LPTAPWLTFQETGTAPPSFRTPPMICHRRGPEDCDHCNLYGPWFPYTLTMRDDPFFTNPATGRIFTVGPSAVSPCRRQLRAARAVRRSALWLSERNTIIGDSVAGSAGRYTQTFLPPTIWRQRADTHHLHRRTPHAPIPLRRGKDVIVVHSGTKNKITFSASAIPDPSHWRLTRHWEAYVDRSEQQHFRPPTTLQRQRPGVKCTADCSLLNPPANVKDSTP